MSENKIAVSVAEMARMVRLSRARFYQLMGGTFPEPSRDPSTGRPFYTAEQQQTCLEVRRRNCGVDGRPVLFYSKVGSPASTKRPAKPKPRKQESHSEILAAIRSLGLSTANDKQVDAAIKTLFPNGTKDTSDGEVIRAVFLYLKRQDSPDNVG